MARTTITKTTALGAYGDYSVADAADLATQAADTTNNNQFLPSSQDLLIVRNSGGSAYTITVHSVADPTYNREGDITTYSIGAGEIAIFGPFRRPGWVQSDGYIYVDGSNAALLLGVVALPG